MGDFDEILEKEQKSLTKSEKKLLFFATIIILFFTFFVANIIIKTAKKPEKKKPAEKIVSVKTKELIKIDYNVLIDVMGEIIPKTEAILTPRVTGEITSVHKDYIEGGFIDKGQEIVKIDDKDYKLALTQKKASLAQAKASYNIELGQQKIALKDYQAIEKENKLSDFEKYLALRKPYLEKAKAILENNKALVKKARLDLKRTSIRAPFNAIVKTVYSDLGEQVSNQSQIAHLVGVDKFYLKALVSVDKLRWLIFPNKNNKNCSTVFVETSTGGIRQAKLVKLYGNLEEKGKMAQILIEIDDPLDMNVEQDQKSPILLNEYISAKIEGIKIKDVFQINRKYFHDNNSLYLLTKENKLKIIHPEIIFKDKDNFYVRGLKGNTNLIISSILTPVEGMKLAKKTNKKYKDTLTDKIEKKGIKAK